MVEPLYRSMTESSQGLSPIGDLVLLRPALEAARRALRRLEDDQVPPRLRNIARRSGRLPAPLARTLLAELERSEWLRAESAQEMGEEEGSDAAGRASLLFLERPTGWEVALAQLVEDRAAGSKAAEDRRLETRLRAALARVGRLEEKLAEAQHREQELATEVAARLESQTASHEKALGRLRSANLRLRRQASQLAEQVEALDLQKTVVEQRLEAVRVKRDRRSGAAAPAVARLGLSRVSGDPLALATHLDDVLRAAALSPPAREASLRPPEQRVTASFPALPGGVRPDRAEAVAWLLAVTHPVVVAIDGWNAAHLLKSPPDTATRDRILEAARRIRIASAGKRVVRVVFDSSQSAESFVASDIEVRFVPSADDELIDMADQDPSGLIIITSDRRVREAVERAGAVGLWSEALIDWLQTAGRRSFGA